MYKESVSGKIPFWTATLICNVPFEIFTWWVKHDEPTPPLPGPRCNEKSNQSTSCAGSYKIGKEACPDQLGTDGTYNDENTISLIFPVTGIVVNTVIGLDKPSVPRYDVNGYINVFLTVCPVIGN